MSCILNGYPGTSPPAWQRFGRAGRRQRTAVGVLVATSDPLDQYLARNPDFFLGASPEHARIDPDQLADPDGSCALRRVRAAVPRDAMHSAPRSSTDNSTILPSKGVVHREGARWHWIADSYPANTVSLRSVAEGNFVVVDITDGGKRIIAEVDYSSAALTLYEGAIYMVQAAPWQVEQLDWVGRKAFVRKIDADYYTDAIDYTKLKVLDDFESARSGRRATHDAWRGACRPARRRLQEDPLLHAREHRLRPCAPAGSGDAHDRGVVAADRARCARARVPDAASQALDGFLGAAYALHHIAALCSLAELRDIGRAVGDGNGAWSAVVDAQGRGVPRTLNGTEARSRARGGVPADRVSLRQLSRRHRPRRAAA